jgi:hypothetical protein
MFHSGELKIPISRERVGANFDRLAGSGREYIDPRLVREDIGPLDEAAESIRRYASEAVAHAAATPSDEIPTWSELHAVIDVIGELLQKYYSLSPRAGSGI